MSHPSPGNPARTTQFKFDRINAERAASEGRAWGDAYLHALGDVAPAAPYLPAWDAAPVVLPAADLRPGPGVGREAAPYLLLPSHKPKHQNPEKKSTPPLYYCPRSRFILVGPNTQGPGVLMRAAPCKSNSCPYCGRVAMHRKQRRIEQRLEDDRDWGHDRNVDYRFVTSTLRPLAFYADNDTLRARVARRLAGNVERGKNLRKKRRAVSVKMKVVQLHRAAVLSVKVEKLQEAIARRDEVRAKGFPTGKRDADIARRELAITHYRLNTVRILADLSDRLGRALARHTLHTRRHDRKRRRLRERRRQIVHEDAGLTPEAASLARAFRILKPCVSYARRQVQRPRKWNPGYRRANWEGCRLECLNDVDIQPGSGYPHTHGLNWVLKHDLSSIHELKPSRRRRFLIRLRQEQHSYYNNALRNACLETPLRWQVGQPYPYTGTESWGAVNDAVEGEDGQDSRARSTSNCVRYMCFHNGKIWRDGRSYPPRYRRFAATKNLLLPTPEKPPSEWRFVQRSLDQVTARLASQSIPGVPGLQPVPRVAGSEECAQDGKLLGLALLTTLDGYRLRWALGDAPGGSEQPAPVRDAAAAAQVAAADQDLAALLDYWEHGQGETWEEWRHGLCAASLSETQAPEIVDTAGPEIVDNAEPDPFGGPVYHPETWRVVRDFPGIALDRASQIAAHTERARVQRAAQTTKGKH